MWLRITSKEELYYCGIESKKDCLYCNEIDLVDHTFIECHLSKSFLSHVVEGFNSEYATSYSLSTEEFFYLENLAMVN